MPHGLSVLAHQQRPTVVTLGRLEINHSGHLFDRLERTPMSGVSRLPTGLAPRRGTLGAWWSTRRIRRRRLGRVLRIAPQLFAQLGHFSLQSCHLRLERLHPLPQGNHDRLDSRWSAIPIFFRNGQSRWQWHNTTRSRQAIQPSGVHTIHPEARLVYWHCSVVFRPYDSCQGSDLPD